MVNGMQRTAPAGPSAGGNDKENDTYPLGELSFGPVK